MRLLFLNHNVAWSGGTFFRAFHFGRELARRGHEVTLVTISPTSRFRTKAYDREGVRLIETPDLCWGSARSGWDPWDTLSRLLLVRKGGWDVVHAFDSRPAVIVPALALRRKGVPLAIDWADWWGRGGTIEERRAGRTLRPIVRAVETYFEERFRTRAALTTVISEALAERAAHLGVDPDSIVHLPQGADVKRVTPRSLESCRQKLGLAPGELVVGYLGVLNRSDAELLFAMFAALRRKGPGSDAAKLMLIGRHKAVVPWRDGVIETGFVAHDEMLTCLGACDIMVLPMKDTVSSRGRWPSKIGDYLAAGRAVAATEVGDVRRLFGRHAIGITSRDEPDALADACWTLWTNPELRRHCGCVARELAESELAWTKLAARLEPHYQSLNRPGTADAPALTAEGLS